MPRTAGGSTGRLRRDRRRGSATTCKRSVGTRSISIATCAIGAPRRCGRPVAGASPAGQPVVTERRSLLGVVAWFVRAPHLRLGAHLTRGPRQQRPWPIHLSAPCRAPARLAGRRAAIHLARRSSGLPMPRRSTATDESFYAIGCSRDVVVFPHDHEFPSGCLQQLPVAFVPTYVGFEFLPPPCGVGLGDGGVGRATVPEAAPDLDGDSRRCEDDVRPHPFPRHDDAMQPVAQATPVQLPSKCQFGRRVARLLRRHLPSY